LYLNVYTKQLGHHNDGPVPQRGEQDLPFFSFSCMEVLLLLELVSQCFMDHKSSCIEILSLLVFTTDWELSGCFLCKVTLPLETLDSALG
jgi:hypothetical protein